MTTYEINGALTGELYWPIGAGAGKEYRGTFTREESQAGPFGPVYAPSLEEMAEYVTLHEGGDFSTAARFTADTVLIVRHETYRDGSRVTRERWRPLADFPSLAAYVAADVYSFDFNSEEE